MTDPLKGERQRIIEQIRKEEREKILQNVGRLRQWLNEDHITDPKKMVTNEQIMHWLNLK